MFDSRSFSQGGHQMFPTREYDSRIIIFRPYDQNVDPNGQSNFSGPLGTEDRKYKIITRNWPCSIVSASKGNEPFLPAGETEIATYRLICNWIKLPNGFLIIRERDILLDTLNDLNTPNLYEVIAAHDPGNKHINIIADLKNGTVSREELRF